MGNINSTSNKKKRNEREYRSAEVRAKDRFEAVETVPSVTAYEASIDKGPYVDPLAYNENASDRISWELITQIWHQAVRGSDDDKKDAVAELSEYWKQRTGSQPSFNDSVLTTAWLTIAREAIINQLSSKSGLQLKLSANSRFIFCRVRAPIRLLELQADKENYNLQFRGEIDPGSENFWNIEVKKYGVPNPIAPELEEDKKMYTKDEANIILEKLYRCNKISPNDLGVNTATEVKASWSRRVHALERIADKVPIYNKYPAYAKFSSLPHHRHLYNTYPSVRGKTLFRAKDRLYLTKSLLDNFFDLDVFATDGVVDSFFALHDANRGEKVTIEVLQKRWVTFWRVNSNECGAPYVTHYAFEDGEELWWYLRIFSQPLGDIRDYFGEKVALYFAWLGYYTLLLTIPAILGLAIVGVYIYRGYIDTKDNIDGFLVGLTLIVILWSSAYKKLWEREVDAIKLKWGITEDDEEEKDRPQFRGEDARRSVVTNQIEAYYPEDKRTIRVTTSIVALFFLVAILLSFIGAIFYADSLVVNDYTQYEFSHFLWVESLIIAVAIQINVLIYKPVAKYFNDSENHRTETAYEDYLIVKYLAFQLINNFSALCFTAYGKGSILNSCSYSCMYDLRVLLLCIVMVRLATDIIYMMLPTILKFISDTFYKQQKKLAGKGLASSDENTNLTSSHDDDLSFIEEYDRATYEGTLISYSEAVVQYGFVNWYTMALPIMGFVALIENLLHIRLDALKLCSYSRRPHVLIHEDMDIWNGLMEMVAYMGCINSVAVLVFTSSSFDEYSFTVKVILFLIIEQFALLFKYSVSFFIPSDAQWVKNIHKRQKYIVNKHLSGYEDEGDNFDLSNLKGNLDDNVDVEGLNLYDIRKAINFTEEDYEQMEQLEAKRRDYNNEIRVVKNQLNIVYKTETLNEITGVGETKHGLPLGRLSVKLVEIQNLSTDTTGIPIDATSIKIRISIKGTKPSQLAAGPPLGPRSDSTVVKLDSEGHAILNQSLGPYAPIRTQDADVIFDILDMGQYANEASIALTSIKLRDLQDQSTHDKVLYLKVRTDDGQLKLTQARIFVSLTFQYSKVVPLRNRIYEIQDKLRNVEKELALIKAGKKLAKNDDNGIE